MARSNRIVKLVTRTSIKSEGCVKALENMLAQAKRGELTGVAVAGVDAEGFSYSAYEGGENIATLIGAVERVKFRLLQHQDES